MWHRVVMNKEQVSAGFFTRFHLDLQMVKLKTIGMIPSDATVYVKDDLHSEKETNVIFIHGSIFPFVKDLILGLPCTVCDKPVLGENTRMIF